jgi:F420-dependent oxidoreductase-like protein
MPLAYAGGFRETVEALADYERAGLDLVAVAEAYSFDAISQLGYIAREIVEICRQVWRRERVQHDGPHYQIPLLPPRGSGLGKPLKLINHPVRPRIPVALAAIGPKNVALAAEIAESWQPIFFHPGKADDVWGKSLTDGLSRRDPALGPLDVMAPVSVAIGADVEDRLDRLRPSMALYIGGMGARGKNFYNELTQRYGYETEAKIIQDLYLAGKKQEAAAAVPEELIRAVSLVGPKGYVAERLAEFGAAGATTLMVTPLVDGPDETIRLLATLRDILS